MVNWVTIIVVPFVVLIALCIYWSYKPIGDFNQCQMTYMFNQPQYIKVKLDSSMKKMYPNYNIYIYGESDFADKTRSVLPVVDSFPELFFRKGRLDGHPIVFIPGNAGSYQQVRSLASIGYQMSIMNKTSKYQKLNYFTLDFNEERAGMFGSLLVSQISFAKSSLQVIRDLYAKSNPKLKNVPFTIIGHSIGGIVGRGLVLDTLTSGHDIKLLITLSAPHVRPVVPLGETMVRVYESINQKWAEMRKNLSDKLVHVSMSGGYRDTLVMPYLSILSNVPSNIAMDRVNVSVIKDVSIITTAIPNVSITIDHLSMVWCKQLTMRITKLLLEVTESSDMYMISRSVKKYFIPDNMATDVEVSSVDVSYGIQAVFDLFHYRPVLYVQRSDDRSSSRVYLTGLANVHDVFIVKIKATCDGDVSKKSSAAVQLYVPWNIEESQAIIPSNDKSTTYFTIQLNSERPKYYCSKNSGSTTDHPMLNFVLEANCSYDVTIKRSFLHSVIALIRYHDMIIGQSLIALLIFSFIVQYFIKHHKLMVIVCNNIPLQI